jgi:hypothetical protein
MFRHPVIRRSAHAACPLPQGPASPPGSHQNPESDPPTSPATCGPGIGTGTGGRETGEGREGVHRQVGGRGATWKVGVGPSKSHSAPGEHGRVDFAQPRGPPRPRRSPPLEVARKPTGWEPMRLRKGVPFRSFAGLGAGMPVARGSPAKNGGASGHTYRQVLSHMPLLHILQLSTFPLIAFIIPPLPRRIFHNFITPATHCTPRHAASFAHRPSHVLFCGPCMHQKARATCCSTSLIANLVPH